ncbi:transcription-repair coupling factor [Luteolibacter flavescens]|uniref:Transcription-repair-coupling factor n=1 Tax=Luteolibacter flavescens TaxID=1859460 RepID=A0ABT3FIP5_9BACT|nr:transcription-repair coupling factor [Luteolibacter flavescens]MCW1883436.1 transcription-repair coupling factor [Luteolibacter flavescens]
MPRKADDQDDWLQRAIEQPDFAQRLTHAVSGEGIVVFDHIDEAAHAWLAAVICKHLTTSGKKRLWLVCDAPRQRERLAAELEMWGIDAADLPEMPVELEGGQLSDPESAALRLEVLDTASQRDAFVILCGAEAFSQGAPSPTELAGSRIVVKQGAGADPLDLAAKLSAHGYDRVTTVQGRGQFAVRGGILDVFPWQGGRPLRIEFFGDEVDSLREFDVDTQASIGKLPQAELLLAEPELEATVADYVRKGDVRIAFEDADVEAGVRIISGAPEGCGEEDFSIACYGSPLGTFEAGDFVLEQSRRQRFFDQIDEWRALGWRVGMVFSNKGEEDRFLELAGHEAVAHVIRLRGELIQGFTVQSVRMAVLSSSELFGRYRTPGTIKRSRQETKRILTARASLDDIEEGDLVVHYEYGIGRFRGIAPGESGEEISIEYKDGGLLSVPIDQAHLVAKYVGLGGKTPELNKLGGAAWKNIRKSAEKSILDYAAQLLRIQAERQAEPGTPHPPDSRWMWEFENSFHYTETPDQRRAIEQSKRDMESAKPMDRLICGDVGFGKTEVAIRAAFKAATGGMQVALLVPTTVLAEQHWRTFRERMSDYPIRVDLLNRFRTPAQVRQTIQGLSDGSVDIVIGTHRLISGDVHFKNLGLAIVDEEQRFGVKHKEKFKELFRSIDVMTLSATPIPRTLYMALMGARDMSTIDTPPPNRVPVHTSVVQYDERIIRDAILREMKRGGQVFFLHNRVKSIEMMRKKLQELVPEARILVGHGQMDKDELEVVMRNFVHGEADILLATTIIETGIDIPNANTILIDRADRFGLADLYQLRGRVGRAGEKAYAILLLPRDFITAGDARKRIHAIKQYTALGSGFKIAMRDLEIRGAGNLLGTKQSGHIAAVGFDLYCQLLRQSVDRLQGKTPKARVEATFRSDFVAFSEAEFARGSGDGPLLPAYLPSGWLDETQLRVSAYRELAESMVEKDLDQMESRWRDRFGRLPEPAENLITVGRIRLVAAGKGVASVEIKGQRLMLQRGGDYIMLEGRRFPRLTSTDTKQKLHEALEMLRAL